MPRITKNLTDKVEAAYRQVEKAVTARVVAEEQYGEAVHIWSEANSYVEGVQIQIGKVEKKIRNLRRKLPAGDTTGLIKQEEQIRFLNRQISSLFRERDKAEAAIEVLLADLRKAAQTIVKTVTSNFEDRAKPFFGDQVRLVYAPRKERISQGRDGKQFEFPAFELEMNSAGSSGKFIRRELDQVSYSQGVYLDIIFRMSLMDALSPENITMVVDGPEGGLDAVFRRKGLVTSSVSFRRQATA